MGLRCVGCGVGMLVFGWCGGGGVAVVVLGLWCVGDGLGWWCGEWGGGRWYNIVDIFAVSFLH